MSGDSYNFALLADTDLIKKSRTFFLLKTRNYKYRIQCKNMIFSKRRNLNDKKYRLSKPVRRLISGKKSMFIARE